MNCCFCFFAEEARPSARILAAAVQYRRVFPDRPFFLMAPEGMEGTDAYLDALAPAHVRNVPAACVSGVRDRGLTRLTPEFYDLFSGYDYVVVASLRQTWPLYDALDWWMEREYDYLAAPWLSLAASGSEWTRGLDAPRGGRDEMSMRRVPAMREFVRRVVASRFDVRSRGGMYEDVVLSGGLPRANRVAMPEPVYCPRAEQARFAWDRPSDLPAEGCTSMETLMSITRGHLPMFLFDPRPEVRERLCIPDVPPRTVFVFSSAVRREHDYERLVADAEPDPSKRLLVFANKCRAFRENESGWRLVEKSPRILTVHNECRDAPFGPSWRGEVPLYLAQRGWKGRHDTLTVHWTPWNCANPTVATVDGEIVHTRATRALRAARVVKNPTAGYQTYAILRDRWPDATICLVNFFGNTNGFVVNKCHDVSWEQEAFRRDPKVRMLYCEGNQ